MSWLRSQRLFRPAPVTAASGSAARSGPYCLRQSDFMGARLFGRRLGFGGESGFQDLTGLILLFPLHGGGASRHHYTAESGVCQDQTVRLASVGIRRARPEREREREEARQIFLMPAERLDTLRDGIAAPVPQVGPEVPDGEYGPRLAAVRTDPARAEDPEVVLRRRGYGRGGKYEKTLERAAAVWYNQSGGRDRPCPTVQSF